MPSKKEWVIDEKGFHAKSTWETMPSDKTVVNIDENEYSSGKDKNNDKYEVELQKGTWLEGAEGFQFNQKCKVRVEGKFLKKTNRTRVTINTYTSFRDDKNDEVVKEPLGQTIETDLEKVNKDGMEAFAEAEVMLYYGDKYSKAMRENPDLTCRYTFTAQSNVANKIMDKCEELEMPQTPSTAFREVEILSATDDAQENSNLRIVIDSDDEVKKYVYKEKEQELKPETELPGNKKITIQIPQSARQPVFTLYPDTQNRDARYDIPLESFINPDTNDPVKLFLFRPQNKNSVYSPTPLIDGDTSYLNGLTFSQVTDDDNDLLFVQEMNKKLPMADGPVTIDNLSHEQCELIVKEILGDDFEEQLDKEKVEKGEKKTYWPKKKDVMTTALETVIDVDLQRDILQDFGFRGKFYLKTTNGKQYVVFKGLRGLRKWYTGTRYSVMNPKVLSLSAAGKLKSGLRGNGLTFIFVGAIDIAEWMINMDDDKQVEDLFVTLGMDAAKMVIGSIITAGIVAGVLAIIGSATLPVCIVIGGTIAIGIIVGLGLDLLDTKIGASEYAKEKGRESGSFLEEKWQEYFVEPLGRKYYQLEKTIHNRYFSRMRISY